MQLVTSLIAQDCFISEREMESVQPVSGGERNGDGLGQGAAFAAVGAFSRSRESASCASARASSQYP